MSNTMINKALLVLVLCAVTGLAWGQSLESANAAFDRGDYSAALDEYQELAQAGDKFAQYRYGLMNYFGLGTEQDKMTAYAWMTTAAEEQTESLRRFQILIWNELERDERDEATTMAVRNEIMAGTEVVESRRSKARRLREQRNKCTGSRVGSCGAIEAFGVSFSNRDRDGAIERNIPHAMTAEEVEDFEKQYGPVVMRDFARFDQNS